MKPELTSSARNAGERVGEFRGREWGGFERAQVLGGGGGGVFGVSDEGHGIGETQQELESREDASDGGAEKTALFDDDNGSGRATKRVFDASIERAVDGLDGARRGYAAPHGDAPRTKLVHRKQGLGDELFHND